MKRIWLVLMASILAMGSLGVAYAGWSQQLTVTESVNSGRFCLQFGPLPPAVLDPFKPPPVFPTATPDWGCSPGLTNVHPSTKNVAWGEAAYVDANGDGLNEQLVCKLFDVYPCYYNHFDFWVSSCGTIPAKLPKVLVKDDLGNLLFEITQDGQLVTLDLNKNGVPDFEFRYGDHIGSQFQYNPGDEINISFGVHLLQDEDPNIQGKTFTFVLELPFVQFNA